MTDRDTERHPAGAGEDGFFARWSRRKQAAMAGQPLPEPPPPASPPPAAAPAQELVPLLPDPQTLDFAADFSAYLKDKVPAAMKRAAMKKLFSDPVFNQMDGLDVYIEDFNLIPDLSASDAALLAHAREVLSPAPARSLAELVAGREGQSAGADGAADVAAAESAGTADDAGPLPEDAAGRSATSATGDDGSIAPAASATAAAGAGEPVFALHPDESAETSAAGGPEAPHPVD